ncbi:ATP-grasp fold subdomain 1 [Penicillium cf. griseofulvum]|uniref:ATP-grasp fold subdomain 1 n=1 Tax=Penicillium cf. griseofulvum TaxID=2972120 RepID=A0A9W9M4L0_9EURO|nr:ATP-grasp fold subdomain 1 [Penicillium cf. griseofulvum]KAJ5434737.1 ATP-grasp fold subdomain 1 [Penicillium cf. griseofulvum]KAJ5452568.1 ATP-grasp fold subdomain 1 [Penicillium cf. griseofulvum]
MRNTRDTGLNIAFIYDPKAYYLERGYSETDCADLADEVTVKAVTNGLCKLGHSVISVPGIKHLVAHLVAGEEKNWDLVFNFSEGVCGSARESQVPALLEAYGVPYTFSNAATLTMCIDKAKTKVSERIMGQDPTTTLSLSPPTDDDLQILLQHYRIPTSPFELVPKYGPKVDYSSLAKELSYPLFAKPTAASTSNGILPSNKIFRHEDLEKTIESLRCQFTSQDIMLEEFLSGREFTVAIFGTGSSATVLGALEMTWYNPEGHESDTSIDFATSFSKAGRGPGQDMGHIHADMADPLVKTVADVALSAYQVLRCRDAGRVDIRLSSQKDNSVPYVIEVNPLFGLRDDYSLFTCIARNNGLEYHDLIAEIIARALQRRNGM